ncbi:hypothetical protein OV320_0641 [Actinobacteria bacterium OV320]|nr:hypothetical protein OV320_0641 [Actinobacteria bacterium OV320]
MAPYRDPPPGRATGDRGVDVRARPQGHHLGPHDPGRGQPVGESDRDNHWPDSRPEHGHDEDAHQQVGHGREGVDDAPEAAVDPAAQGPGRWPRRWYRSPWRSEPPPHRPAGRPAARRHSGSAGRARGRRCRRGGTSSVVAAWRPGRRPVGRAGPAAVRGARRGQSGRRARRTYAPAPCAWNGASCRTTARRLRREPESRTSAVREPWVRKPVSPARHMSLNLTLGSNRP